MSYFSFDVKFINPQNITLILTLIIRKDVDNLSSQILRTLILNKNGQFTITLPRDVMVIMGAKSGDKFKFIYHPKDTDVLKIVRMGCNAT